MLSAWGTAPIRFPRVQKEPIALYSSAMRKNAVNVPTFGSCRRPGGLVASALMLMVLLETGHANAGERAEPVPPAEATKAEPDLAPDGSSLPDAQAETTEATPAPNAPAIPPPPAYVPPAGYGPPPGNVSPYDRPPPGYPTPPPGYEYHPYGPPRGYPYASRQSPFLPHEEPLPDEERGTGSPRSPYMLSLGFGMSALSGGFSSPQPAFRVTEPGMSYSIRFAVAASERGLIVLALDGTWANFSDSRLDGGSSRSSTTYTIGAQYFISPSLYSRLGVGLGCLQWSDEHGDQSNCAGMAASGGVGIEFFQQHNLSMAAELAGTLVRYTSYGVHEDDTNDVWFSLGGNVVLSFF
jgi:hypothetical protein